MRHYSFEDLDDIFVQDIRKKEYETLSYAWGAISFNGSHLTEMIFIDSMPLQVTAQLNRALRRIRQLRRLVGLIRWVDAVCINQRDLQERNHQVAKMDEIYWKSRNTVVWLGEFDTESDASMFAQLCRRIRSKNESMESRRLLPHHAEVLSRLMARTWFSRRWVIQEYALSLRKVFLVGDQWISHTDMLEAIGRLYVENVSTVLTESKWLDNSAWDGGRDTKPVDSYDRSLLQRLHVFQSAAHSHPHDCIYALLDIALDRHLLTIDYNLSLPDLFISVAREYARYASTLPLLFASALIRPRNPIFPSWLPDWSVRQSTAVQLPLDSTIPFNILNPGLHVASEAEEASRSAADLASSSLERPEGTVPEVGQAAAIVDGRYMKMWTYLLDAELIYETTLSFTWKPGVEQRAIVLEGVSGPY